MNTNTYLVLNCNVLSLFTFYALPSGGKLKEAVVHSIGLQTICSFNEFQKLWEEKQVSFQCWYPICVRRSSPSLRMHMATIVCDWPTFGSSLINLQLTNRVNAIFVDHFFIVPPYYFWTGIFSCKIKYLFVWKGQTFFCSIFF